MPCKSPDFKCKPKPMYICNFDELADVMLDTVDLELVQTCMRATQDGTGFNTGDIITRNLFYDVTVDPPVLVATTYYNSSQGSALASLDGLENTFESCNLDREVLCKCFVDSAGDQFFRLFWIDAIAETVVGYTDIDEQGNSFTPAEGDISPCDDTEVDVEMVCMSDDNGRFLRHIVYSNGTITSTYDTDYSGVAYVTVGTVEPCEDIQREYVNAILCGTTVLAEEPSQMAAVASPNTFLLDNVYPATYSNITSNSVFPGTPSGVAVDPSMTTVWATQGSTLYNLALPGGGINSSVPITGDYTGGNVEGLSFDYSTGQLWIVAGSGSNPLDFYTVDTTTGVTTYMGSTPFNYDFTWGVGFDIDNAGNIYIGHNGTADGVYRVDPNTFAIAETIIDNATLDSLLDPNSNRIRQFQMFDLNRIYINGSQFLDRLFVFDLVGDTYVEQNERSWYPSADMSLLASSPIVYSENVKFNRVYEIDEETGQVIGYVDYDLEGNDITGTLINIGTCEDLDNDVEVVCMTDDNGDFLRHFIYQNGALVSTFDTDNQGEDYEPVGATVPCANESVDVEVVCMYDPDVNVTFFRHFVYEDGVLQSNFDTDEDGGAYVPTGTPVPCDGSEAINEFPQYVVLTGGGTWNPPVGGATAITVTVIDDTDGVTLTTQNHTNQPLYTGQTISFTAEHGLLNGTFTITYGAGAIVAISYMTQS